MAANTVAGDMGSGEFGILGPLQVSMSGRMVPLGGPRQRAVLALLLLEANRVVSMDRLAEDVWAGHPPAGWATTLQTYVFHLRRALEPGRVPGVAGGVLVTSGRGYVLRVDREHLDAALFQAGFTAGRAALEAGRYAEAAETLRKALGLWRSPVLADLADYEFTRPEAARLEELRLAALESRIDADLALGRHDALTGELERLVGEHPLRERLHGQLMLALYRCGRQAEALAAYRRVRELLADELGIDPGEPLRRRHEAVLAQDPALDWSGDDRSAPAEVRHAGAGTPASSRPGALHLPAISGRRELDWARRRARRLLAVGLALAAAAAVCIVVVARPWAAGPAGLPADSVGLFDSTGGRVGAPVRVGSPAGLAYGGGSVWAVDSAEGRVARINPDTHAVVDQIRVGSAPSAVTVTGENVWVADSGDGTVRRINTVDDKVVQNIRVGNLPVAVASGRSGVWVANENDDTVYRIDPATGTVTRKVQVGARPDGIAVGPDAVWVANGEDNTITRIDPATGQATGPMPVGSGPQGIAITPGAVWVANSLDLTVWKIDPTTGTVEDTIHVGDGPSTIVAARNAIWVTDEFDATLYRIDPQNDQVVRVVHLGSAPRGIVAAGSGVWVAARPFAAASHRGGTLTVLNFQLPATDPAGPDPWWTIAALTTVYDGLVALRRSGGPPGLTLVPDLAVALPRPADGGTTYTFTLRRGIRYSNGVLVRASDFRRGLERTLSLGSGSGYYQDILGAPACLRQPGPCDLAAGIVANDTTRTVTFYLSRPDPDLLYELALLYAVPVPPGAPSYLVNKGPPFVPGTGPYMISRFRPNVSFTLVRNRRFRQWSYAAQPRGYPNVIRYKYLGSQSERERAVIARRADLVLLDWDDQSLAIRYPNRIHLGLKLANYYVFLNTRQPPFNSLKARQAVNYAVDRALIIRLVRLANGQAAPTCQILPANFPGHLDYCAYTAGNKDGAWHLPDMRKARHLAKQSGMTNVPVTFLTLNYFPWTAVGYYFVRLLTKLGYQARLRLLGDDAFFAQIYNPTKTQIGIGPAWGSDFPAPSTFFIPLLSCGAFYLSPTSTTNAPGFCDPRLDDLVKEARAAQLINPAGARKLWAQADRIATDEAPLVPLYDETSAAFVSSRVGNYQASPEYGPLLDQMWVR
jgi:YVTN family beta-propeller protein